MVKDLNAGHVEPGDTVYHVRYTHNHPTLEEWDRVVVREVGPPGSDMVLVRASDSTIHSLKGEFDQYVHLQKMSDDV